MMSSPMFKLFWVILLCGVTFGKAAGISESDSSEASPRELHHVLGSGKCAEKTLPFFGISGVADEGAMNLIRNEQIPLVESELAVPSPPLEIEPLIVSGPFKNRVDLVFFSDGYIEKEKEKFIDDAMRLAEDLSGNQTFNTVKPLMNFWAAFTPSEESGVGVGGKPKKTPYGLYRDGTELRAVYYAHPEVAGAACSSMGDQCDFPILLGNDPLYGGLGGRFTVITSSVLNGPQILRHELGHSIIPVGEEYDGGFAYFGADAYHNLSEPIPWAHWLSRPEDHEKEPRVERSVMPMQAYPWTLLNTTTSWSTNFVSSGTFSRHLVRFSLSGLPEKADLKVELDGVDLGWEPKVGLGLDRWHYDLHVDRGLSGGEHEVKFTLLNGEREGVAQLCSTEILEFGNENEFVSSPGYYGVFPTYSDKNETSYRPTNEDCLMRIVTTPNFCKVCLESLWHALLRRVNLIDSVSEACIDGGVVLNATLVPLAQFREDEPIAAESYTITWSKNGKVLEDFTNQTKVEVGEPGVGTQYTLNVKLSTPEVIVDKEGNLEDEVDWVVEKTCV